MCLWLLRCCFGPSCCECCDDDDWTLEQDCRTGERGCGWIYKRGKGAAIWSKRFFVLSNEKFIYYTEQDRQVAKGEIILTNAEAKVSSTRSDEKKKFHFVISHPVCGTRELYAASNRHRQMWVSRINDIARAVTQVGHFGKILKQGGIMKDTWQERWCHCVGKNLDYFENASDNQVKGSLDLYQAKIKEYSLKDQKYAFELVAANPGKKGMKKYVFAADTESDRKKWIQVMTAASNGTNNVVFSTPGDTKNPMQGGSESSRGSGSTKGGSGKADEAVDDEDVERGSFSAPPKSRAPSIVKPADKMGILQKKSPTFPYKWQTRYFVLKEPGEICYFADEAEYKSKIKAKGDIQVGDILPNAFGLVMKSKGEFEVKLKERSFELKASTDAEANEWKTSIEAWIDYCKEEV